MEKKDFAIKEIKHLTDLPGYCLATDRIMRDGLPVGYMYRETPDNENDSGWRFFSGDEDQDYVDNPDNIGLYALNTVANYSPDIIPLLESPYGSSFARAEDGSGKLESIDFPKKPGFSLLAAFYWLLHRFRSKKNK